jgi:hypothetical protein
MKFQVLTAQELVDSYGKTADGSYFLDQLIKNDPLLGPDYGEDESPVEVDLLAPMGGVRAYIPAAVIEDGKVLGFQFVLSQANLTSNLDKLDQSLKWQAIHAGVTQAIFSLGPMLITDPRRNEVFNMLFRGIFEQFIPDFAKAVRLDPDSYLKSNEIYPNRTLFRSRQSLVRSMGNPLLSLESASVEDVDAMYRIGQESNWAPPIEVSRVLGEVQKILVGPTLSATLQPGAFMVQFRAPNSGRVVNERTYLESDKISHEELKEFMKSDQITQPQIVDTNNGTTTTIQFPPTPESRDHVLQELNALGASKVAGHIIARAVLAMR